MASLITPEQLPIWVPGKVLSASDDLGWKDVKQRTYCYRGLDVPIPPMDHYMLVRYRSGQTPMDRCFDERWTRTSCAPGDISLLTVSQPSHWHWTQDIVVSHVYVSHALMARVADDMLERPVAEVRLHDLLRAQDPTLMAITDAVTQEAQGAGLGGALYVEALGVQLAVHLLRHYASVSYREPQAKGRLSPLQLRRLQEFIEARLHENLSLDELAAVVGLGVWTFSRRFRASLGCAPHAYVVAQRVQRARRLLIDGALAVKEVASLCGFSDQAHMTRVLRARLGTTPAQLRQAATPR